MVLIFLLFSYINYVLFQIIFIVLSKAIIMNFLTQIYDEIETELDSEVKKSQKAALYTLVNFIEAYDSGSGIQEKELEERFLQRKEYSQIMQKLIDNSVVEKSSDNGNYKLNPEAKQFITPLLEQLMNMVYKQQSKTASSDPSLNLLYNCSSNGVINCLASGFNL